MRYLLLLFITILSFSNELIAQKTTTSANQVWIAYSNQNRYSKKWGSWTDLHLRTRSDFFDHLLTSIVRVGITYYLTDDAKITAGYAWVNNFPQDNLEISRPEHRPWQQIQWHTKYKKIKLMQWIRLEERFRRKVVAPDKLVDGYNFNYRTRYNILAQFPLGHRGFDPGSLNFVLNDELHVNFGKEIVNNYFDQNRAFIGFSYQFTKSAYIQFGYMNFFQQMASGNQYKNNHVARVMFFHNLDLRK